MHQEGCLFREKSSIGEGGEGQGSKDRACQVGKLSYREMGPGFRGWAIGFQGQWHYIWSKVGAESSVGVWGSALK